MSRIGRAHEVLHPASWPLAIRIPALVVILMLIVSMVISEQVLSRLIATQNKHLTVLTGAYLDGVSSAVLPHVLREDIWETYDALDRATRLYEGLEVAWTTVMDEQGLVLASSQPRKHGIQNQLHDAGEEMQRDGPVVSIDEYAGLSRFRRDLLHQDRRIGTIIGEVRIDALLAERRSVLLTLVLTNAALTTMLAAVGYILIRRMVKPVTLLTNHMSIGPGVEFQPIPEHKLGRPQSEFGRLFRRYNTLVATVHERERLLQTLANEERLAALGRLASVIAHEINNPLGGMLTAVQTLKRHGSREDVRNSSANLIERGLIGMRSVVRSTLATYRPPAEPQRLTAEHLDDLALLVRPEISRKGLHLAWTNAIDGELSLSAHPVRDVALNLLLNACAAAPANSTVTFEARTVSTAVEIRIGDEGPGLPGRLRDFLELGSTGGTPVDEHGLGLWVVRRLVTEAGGSIRVEPGHSRGTDVCVTFPITTAQSGRNPDQELSHVA